MINNAQKTLLHEILLTLERAGLLPHLILIGSWAEYIYEAIGIFDGFHSNIRTRDFDFFVPNTARPMPPVPLKTILQNAGWDIDADALTGTTKFFKGLDTGEVFEVEFLAGMKGVGSEGILDVKSLNIRCQSLRDLNMLQNAPRECNYQGYLLKVPEPEVYVLHKLLINSKRLSPEKRVKDVESVRNLLDHMRTSSWQKRLSDVYDPLTKKQKNAVRILCESETIYLGIQL